MPTNLKQQMFPQGGAFPVATTAAQKGVVSPTLSTTLLSEASVTSPAIGSAGTVDGTGYSFDANGFHVPTISTTGRVNFANGISIGTEGTFEYKWVPTLASSDTSSVDTPIIIEGYVGASLRMFTRVINDVGTLGYYFFFYDGVGITSIKYQPTYAASSVNTCAFVFDSNGIDGTSDKRRFYFNGARETRVSGDLETDAIGVSWGNTNVCIGNECIGANRGAKSTVGDYKFTPIAKTSF